MYNFYIIQILYIYNYITYINYIYIILLCLTIKMAPNDPHLLVFRPLVTLLVEYGLDRDLTSNE